MTVACLSNIRPVVSVTHLFHTQHFQYSVESSKPWTHDNATIQAHKRFDLAPRVASVEVESNILQLEARSRQPKMSFVILSKKGLGKGCLAEAHTYLTDSISREHRSPRDLTTATSICPRNKKAQSFCVAMLNDGKSRCDCALRLRRQVRVTRRRPSRRN